MHMNKKVRNIVNFKFLNIYIRNSMINQIIQAINKIKHIK